ncbi:type IV toxin-antitoxin system AbiEi family antitoxin [Gammaproteobacteria bacterium AB-CW1]|uniref:Type IV toxin-antitoxin system AbiEi family antitoxin n=1 Tax=Natronospira elongata TaxID=3110268 RepID=A0AAP6JFY7_9GAMM|nr:type IV toxin-antitoxin system AbiEi family antitoxin [Gammaproteobacteria bacterium AB-CW1]
MVAGEVRDGNFVHVRRPKDLVEAYLDLEMPKDGPVVRYAVVTRRQVTGAVARNIAARLHQSAVKAPYLLVAEHIHSDAAESLKTLGVQYVDGAGNIFLRSDDPFVHIYLQGKSSAKSRKDRAVRAFQPAGLKVIFTLLSVPGAWRLDYRTLAQYSEVSVGTVVNTLDDLKALEYCRVSGRKRMPNADRENELIDRWVENYLERLRPKLTVHRFRAKDRDWWHHFGPESYEQFSLWLGSESAASVLTKGFLVPGKITVYGEPDLNQLARRLRLQRDDDGDIELLDVFWNFKDAPIRQVYDGKRVCPPLLIYADLIGTGDARCLDAAGMIRGQFL